MKYEQLSFFDNGDEREVNGNSPKEKIKDLEEVSVRSQALLSEIEIMTLPFLGCDFDTVYKTVLSIIPSERVMFDKWGRSKLILAEIICAGICHQMNWDFLRDCIYRKTASNPEWLEPSLLQSIRDTDVFDLLQEYGKPERIRAAERAAIINNIGSWASKYTPIESVFLDSTFTLLSEETIKFNLLQCSAFSKDPEEKKLQLLLQKLSSYSSLSQLSDYCNPAIDYHLIRMYYRRGLFFGRTKYAKDYLENPLPERKEETVAAVRHICSDLVKSISDYTGLNVNSVNQIDWQVGRSVCVQGKPDCNLQSNDGAWLKEKFTVCPYYNTCVMRIHNGDYRKMQEPNYKGESY